MEQWPARLLPRSPFTLCKRTPEALRILNTRRPTSVRLFSLSKRGWRPSAQEFYTINCVTGLTAIFHSNHLRFDLATREKKIYVCNNFEEMENF